MTGRAVPRVRIPLQSLEPLLVELRDVLRAAPASGEHVSSPWSWRARRALVHLEAVLVEVDG